MKRPLLLDTHALLWWMMDDPQLPPDLRQRMADPQQPVLVSAASVWEIAIKRRRGRLSGVDAYLADHAGLHRDWGFQPVAIDPADAAAAGSFDFAHADPFDRVLIAQSRRTGADLATCDTSIRAVHPAVYWS